MAAPGNNSCEKCRAPLPVGATTCPECGAPVGAVSATEAEAAVYPELAKANLARMRGDFKQAEDQLLGILKRYPNNPSANEMLGDLAAEGEDWPHALQWYELALEIVPTSASIARKLKDARARIEQKDAVDTTSQLGLPDTSSRLPLLFGAFIVVLVLVAVGAFFLGARGVEKAPTRPHVDIVKAEPEPTPAKPTPSPTPPEGGVGDDRQILSDLQQKSQHAAAILGAMRNPRDSEVQITFAMSGEKDRELAAQIAREAFSILPGVTRLVLRGVSGGKIAYMADVSLERMTQIESQPDTQNPTAWIDAVLQNEWPTPISASATAGGASAEAGGASAGETPPAPGGG